MGTELVVEEESVEFLFFCTLGILVVCHNKPQVYSCLLSCYHMQIILRFGGKLTDIGRECTHIVSPRVTRTVKFLSGISVCRHIVTPQWVEECGRVGALVDEGDYVLQDHDAEEMFDMNVATSLARARSRKLLTVQIMYM